MANWNDFIAAPLKASRQMHVSGRDVERGAQIDARRRAELEAQKQSPMYPSRENAAALDVRGPLRDAVFFNALLRGPEQSAAASPSRTEQVARAALSGAGSFGGWAEEPVNEPTPDMLARFVGQAVSDPLNAVGLGALKYAGQVAKKALPTATALGTSAYASDAEAGPLSGIMKFLRFGVKPSYIIHSDVPYPELRNGKLATTPLYMNPSETEYAKLKRATMKDAELDGGVPAVRALRDLKTPNTVYAWDGNKLLHDDITNHLKLNQKDTRGTTILPEEDHNTYLDWLRKLPQQEANGGPIKLAGGGSIAGAAKRLAQRAMPMFQEGAAPTMAPRGALSVVKPKDGNWLAGSVEDALRGLKRMAPPEDMARLREAGVPMEAVPRAQALDDWISGPLTKYVKHRMASPEDEVRRLAEEGVLHFEPLGIRDQSPIMRDIVEARTQGGFAPQGYADSPLGDQWEKYADSAIDPRKVRDFTGDQRTIYEPGNEWMKKAPSDTPVYRTDPNNIGTRAVENLGFNHLIDELSNALDPNSGLPRHLQLSPEAVKQMSMEKAVRRVADINAWRAAQKVEANRALAEQASIVREYTDPSMPNPKGLRWVELKGKPLPQDRVKTVQTPHGWSVQDKFLTPRFRGGPQLYGSEKEALEAHAARVDEQALADQLKYEGDTMGHCVGGYCDDVASGRSRIFSLRDAKGEPHVTVEVAPGQVIEVPEGVEPFGDRIVQIKGKQNRKPNDEYLPFVQDFVKNPPHGSPWGDVGDLQNTGLRRIGDAFNPHELGVLRSKGVELHPDSYLTPAELDAHQKLFNNAMTGTDYNPTRAWENFASGGTVQKDSHPPADIRGIIAAMKEYHAHA